jgi:hypothetical protein
MAQVRTNALNRLIVEGRDDQWSVIALTKRYGWDWDNPLDYFPYVDNAKGVDKALESLPVAIRSYSRVGIVVDADMNTSDRWAEVRAKIIGEIADFPAFPDSSGTVHESGSRRVGVWLMPDNQAPGKLEDFLAALVPSTDNCWDWADAAAKGAVERGAEFSESDFIKAHIHTWLAWREEPGLPFGTAITASMFAHDAKLAKQFVDWMNRLYA